jgi:hypothetical protein
MGHQTSNLYLNLKCICKARDIHACVMHQMHGDKSADQKTWMMQLAFGYLKSKTYKAVKR